MRISTWTIITYTHYNGSLPIVFNITFLYKYQLRSKHFTIKEKLFVSIINEYTNRFYYQY